MNVLQLFFILCLAFIEISIGECATSSQKDFLDLNLRQNFFNKHDENYSMKMKPKSVKSYEYDQYSRNVQTLPSFFIELFPRFSIFLNGLLSSEAVSVENSSNDNNLELDIVRSENPTISPSIELTASPSNQPSVVPSSILSKTPTIIPSSLPTEDNSISWGKTLTENGKIVKLSDTGNTLLILKREGSAYIFEKNESSDSWLQANITYLLSDIWGDLLIVSDELTMEISSNGDKFIVGNKLSNEVAVFFFHKIASMWYQVDETIQVPNIDKFGSFISVSIDGSRILAGGVNGLILFELRNNSWENVGSIFYPSGSFSFYSINMNIGGTNVIANVQDHEGNYYGETRTVKRYSLPSFDEFPSYPIDPFLTVIDVSTSNDGNMMALSIFDHDDYYDYDDYFYPKNDVYIYEFDDSIDEFLLISVMDGYYALSNSLSGDGNILVTVDSFRNIDTGEYLFRSHRFQGNEFIETGFAAPDEGDESSIGFSISNDGSIYALVFGDTINVWEISK